MSAHQPFSIILVSSGSKGDKLLFRYPYEEDLSSATTEKQQDSSPCNPYAVKISEDFWRKSKKSSLSVVNGKLVGYTDEILATLFAVDPNMCGKKFELKVDDVRFVGYPTSLQSITAVQSQQNEPTPSSSSVSVGMRTKPTMSLINIVFALPVSADRSLVDYYHDISRRLCVALCHEERRCGYLSRQQNIILMVQDEVATLAESDAVMNVNTASPFKLMLEQCQLAQELQLTYLHLCNNGAVNVCINHWVRISFCIPHIVHSKAFDGNRIDAELFNKCLKGIKPYHGMLLLVSDSELISSLLPDASPALVKLIEVANPLKNLTQLAADSDLTLDQVSKLVCHLVYWAKATVIYPLCDSNVYVIAPNAITGIKSHLACKFREAFPAANRGNTILANAALTQILSNFYQPTLLSDMWLLSPSPLTDQISPLLIGSHQKAQMVKQVIWLLKHQQLLQLHVYVYFLPSLSNEQDNKTFDKIKFGPPPDDANVTGSVTEEKTVRVTEETNIVVKQEDLTLKQQQQMLMEKCDCLKDSNDSIKHSILSVLASSNIEDLKLFLKLLKYFNGDHHIEEIMFYENIRRSNLIALIEKYNSVLITSTHEDPISSGFVSYFTQ